jgi:flagellin-like protein
MNRITTHFERFDDRAVSPVIGVILMVAVTVILAAVVSTLVLGLGGDVQSTPQASFSFDYDGANTVTITHTGGADIDTDDLSVTGGTAAASWNDGGDSEISAGEDGTVAVNGGEELSVVWNGGEGKSSILASYQVPS